MSRSDLTRRADENGDGDATSDGGDRRPRTREQLASAVYAELAFVVRRFRAKAASLHPGLSLTGYTLLLHLEETGGSRAAELVDYYNINKSTVSRQLAELSSGGLVGRELDASDNRVQIVRVTASGRAVLAKVGNAIQECVRTRLDAWPDSDLGTFAQMLARYNALACADPGTGVGREKDEGADTESVRHLPPLPTGATGAVPWI
jgi:DNA-binding MarR family transcriptional regulator